MKLHVTEEYIIDIPQTNDFNEAVDIFHTDASDLYETKHYGWNLEEVKEDEDTCRCSK